MSSESARTWIPLRWPAEWKSDNQISLIEKTPVNCILDAPASVASAAKARGIAVLGKDEAAANVAFLNDPVWPSIKMARRGEGADAGPTGAPWVDANGWSIQLARAMSPSKPVWVDAGPPKDAVLDDRNYALAVAEPAAFGGKWVVNIDPGYAGKLAAGDSGATERWRKLMGAVKFFDTHRAWSDFEVRSKLAVISDFAGSNEFLAREFLNLASRRNLGYMIWPKANAAKAAYSSVQSVLFVDEQPPKDDLARALESFVRNGGMLIARNTQPFSKWTGTASPGTIPGYEARRIGKGQLVTPTAGWEDPWQMAYDVRNLIGRKTDTVRLYNGGIMGTYYTRAKDGKSAVLHLVNYTRRSAAGQVSAAIADPFTTAKAVTPESESVKPLTLASQGGAFREMVLPGFQVYAAVELSH